MDERSGDSAPLCFVPARKTVVVGLVSTKVATLESRRAVVVNTAPEIWGD